MTFSFAIATHPGLLPSTSIASLPSTLVVIDPNVADYQVLAAGVLPGISAVILDGDCSGVEQITAALLQNPGITSVHLVTHGAPGVIYLGNELLNLDSIARYSKELQSWGVESLFIYGCKVAAGDVGTEFLHKLQHLTGAAIAASTTKTGNAALGGNWNLEVTIGNPQSLLVFDQAVQQYAGVLELLNTDDYAALKALYQSTNGANWTDNTGWRDWDFNSTTSPDLSVVSQWKGVELWGDRVASLYLHLNNLSGTIPSELGNLSILYSLDLSANQLSGTIPSSLGSLSSLASLNLGENQLSGAIPVELGNLSKLGFLVLGTNNLSGTIPSQLGNLNNLGSLYLDSNALSGNIPDSILNRLNPFPFPVPGKFNQYNLNNVPFVTAIAAQSMVEDQSLTLSVSVSDIDRGSNDTNLTLTAVSDNSTLIDAATGISVTGTGSDRTITITPITGKSGTTTITITLQDGSGEQTIKTFALTVEPRLNTDDYVALKALYQSTGGANWTDNTGWKDWDFNSDTPPALSVVSQWYGVRLAGDHLTNLDLSNNNLSGSIPSEMGNFEGMLDISLANNSLSGNIPAELGNLSSLLFLYLTDNQLSGSIPIQLGNLSNLKQLYLNNNQLSGSIPTELGNISTLEFLLLSNNQLSGDIPQAIKNQIDQGLFYYDFNNAPFVTSIADQSTTMNNPITLNVSVSDIDVEDNDPNLTLSVTSSNTALIDSNGISVTGNGSDRTITLTPISGQIGTATITMTLQDSGNEQTVKTFELTVDGTLNADDYAALKVLYQSTDGANWTDNTGWKDWDFNSATPPALSVVSQWKGVGWTDGCITSLSLHLNNLVGSIPAELSNLSSVSSIDLGANQLSGTIPTSLSSLSHLGYLNLSENQLSGTIPVDLNNLSNLSYLNLGTNRLTGTIPSQLGDLENLSSLYLNNNALSGDIPTSILNRLFPVPVFFPLPGKISNYNFNNVPFVTAIADQSTPLNQPLTLNVSVSDIDKGSNDTNLTLSVTSSDSTVIQDSDISVTGSGSTRTITLTPTIGQPGTATITMTLKDGSAEQTIKTFNLTVSGTLNADDYAALKALYQSTDGANWTDNTGWRDWDFSSTTPPAVSVVSQWEGVTLTGDRVTALSLISNQLSGTLPAEFVNLSELKALDLSHNQLSGSIPVELGNLTKLEQLNLEDNQLSDGIPTQFGNLSNLVYLNLASNPLSGTLPATLGNLSNLNELILHSNQLSGSVPTSFGNLSNLKTLNLYENQLTGSIPTELSNLTSLTALRLYDNQLSGSIPSSLGNLSNLMFLNVANNQLSGSVPSELGNLSNLVRLNLFKNQLSSSIPAELGNLNKLSLFNLSYNQLSGSIPSELSNLTSLTQFYLNDNQLSGTVPQALLNKLGSLTNYDLGNAPFVTAIANQTTTSTQPLTLTLSISDIDATDNADPTVLTLKAISNNSALIGESGISVSGTGSDRILTLTPTAGQTGTATITLTLQDDSGEKTEKTFTVTVNASLVSTPPTTDPTSGTGTTTLTVTPISSITSLFNATKGEFVVSDALLSLNEETLPSGDLFRLRNGTLKADTLRGTGVNEAMFGKAQNDQIKGQGSNDCLSGGKGNDLLDGGAGNDLIFGDAGNDTLVGGTGNNILIGGTGGDRITTGTGSDQVAFAKPIGGKNIDTITDFNVQTDHIVVLAAGFGGGLVAGQAISATQFRTGTKAIGVNDRFIYNRKTGDLFFDADGSGAGKVITFTHLKAGLNLSYQTIVVV
ncbi:DUF4347 domain-containing protein [Leptolyngbya ohadii]|uniref:DUF4347 domain-containing protein n=1 Tax=Leptolyngbya ohadii TaxID=1962290 RepID=UPI000B59AC54|nr:DUF4347 domain-containing protein [Leptolyngbya ohadii]